MRRKAKVALKLGQVAEWCSLWQERAGLEIHEYSPRPHQATVVGYGQRAEKASGSRDGSRTPHAHSDTRTSRRSGRARHRYLSFSSCGHKGAHPRRRSSRETCIAIACDSPPRASLNFNVSDRACQASTSPQSTSPCAKEATSLCLFVPRISNGRLSRSCSSPHFCFQFHSQSAQRRREPEGGQARRGR